jgi:hypothetical protein
MSGRIDVGFEPHLPVNSGNVHPEERPPAAGISGKTTVCP